MQTYLFAANLFALIAFLLGLNNFSNRSQIWRLLPLFLLVISQSLSLIISSLTPSASLLAAPSIVAGLTIFSVTCLNWSLVKYKNLTKLWQRLAWLGLGSALLFSIAPLAPGWPVPSQILSLMIAMFGAVIILSSLDRLSLSHLAAPLILGAAHFLHLLTFETSSWLLVLLAYGFLIAALYWEGLQVYRGRQQASQAMAQQAVGQSQERQRLIEVSEIISTVPGLEQSMTHLARSMAHVTHADQSAIFTLDVEIVNQMRLIAIYSPERPVYLTSYDEITFSLADCPPLQTAMLKQKQQLIIPDQENHNLDSLYGLWNESRQGPTLIQPLTIQGRSIGALVLGNPVTHQAIQEPDRALCRSLASQMASMTESFRRYLDLELRTELRGEPEKAEPSDPMALIIAADVDPDLKTNPAPAVARQPQAAAETAEITASSAIVIGSALSDDNKALSMAVINDGLDDYLTILETVEEGVVVSNASGQVALVNKAAERILGKRRQDLLGQPIGTIYGAIESSDQIENLATAFSRRNEPLPTFIEEHGRTIQGQLIPWRNPDKEWLGIIAIFSDVTYKIKADQARTNFISALSRVLRGPLTLIRGYAELMMNGLPGEYSTEQLQAQQIIHSSVERVVELLDNAIQISAQSKNKIVPRFEHINVAKVIDDVLREVSSLAKLREVRLMKETRGKLPLIVADHVHLYRILENLLSNACRFTPPGGQVTLRTWVQNSREGNTVRPQLVLAVVDTGIGIPQTEYKRIFDPFYQLNNQQPGAERGMGMGLTVVKELVEMHQGKVWVESIMGEGSIFQVVLPITQNNYAP